MVIQTNLTNLTLIFWDTVGGIVQNLPFFILIIWGVRILARKIDNGFKNLIKDIPSYIEQYDKVKMKHYQINKALR
jgi:hypothetical protein